MPGTAKSVSLARIRAGFRSRTSTLSVGATTTDGTDHRNQIIDWLQGTTRAWPLGDLYHGGATVIGGAGFAYAPVAIRISPGRSATVRI